MNLNVHGALFVLALLFVSPFVCAAYGDDPYGSGAFGAAASTAVRNVRGGGGSSSCVGEGCLRSPLQVIVPSSPVVEEPAAVPPIIEAPVESLLKQVDDEIAQMRGEGFSTKQLERLFRDAKNALGQGDTARAQELLFEVRHEHAQAKRAREILDELEQSLGERAQNSASPTGAVISTLPTFDATRLLVERAKEAQVQEQYDVSASLALQAQQTFALEREQQHGVVSFLVEHWLFVTIYLFIAATVFILVRVAYARSRLSSAMRELDEQKQLLARHLGEVSSFAAYAQPSVPKTHDNRWLIGLCFIVGILFVTFTLDVLAVHWGSTILTDKVETEIGLFAATAANNVEMHGSRIEAMTENVRGIVAHNFDTTRARSDAAYLQEHFLQAGLLAQDLSSEHKEIVGVYGYANPDELGRNAYFWYSLENMTLVGTLDTEIDIADYLRMNSSYKDDPDYVWYFGARTTGRAAWTPVYHDTDLHYDAISYVVPVYVRDRLVAVVGMDMSFDDIKDTLDRMTIYDSGYVVLLDRNGEFIVPPKELLSDWNSVQEEFTQSSGTIKHDARFFGYYKLDDGKMVVIVAPEEEVLAHLRELQQRLLFGAILVTLVLLLFGVVLVDRLFIQRTAGRHLLAPPVTEAREGLDQLKRAMQKFWSDLCELARAFRMLFKR